MFSVSMPRDQSKLPTGPNHSNVSPEVETLDLDQFLNYLNIASKVHSSALSFTTSLSTIDLKLSFLCWNKKQSKSFPCLNLLYDFYLLIACTCRIADSRNIFTNYPSYSLLNVHKESLGSFDGCVLRLLMGTLRFLIW